MAKIKSGNQYGQSRAEIDVTTSGNSQSEITLGNQYDESQRVLRVKDSLAKTGEAHTKRKEAIESVCRTTTSDAERGKKNIWQSGLFYLTTFVISVLIVSAITRFVPWWSIPIVLFTSVLVLVIIGAIELRRSGHLGETSLTKIIIKGLEVMHNVIRAGKGDGS